MKYLFFALLGLFWHSVSAQNTFIATAKWFWNCSLSLCPADCVVKPRRCPASPAFYALSAELMKTDHFPKPLRGGYNISFSPAMNNQPLRTGAYIYRSANGDSLQVDVLRFYICNIQLLGSNGQVYSEKNSYHLIDTEDSTSLVVRLKDVPKGKYTALRFHIGTDSLTNVSGAMEGDLDPTKGMFWAWNSGFINFKIEGKSAACKTLHHAFEFHVGGYMPPYPTIRQVTLPFKKSKKSGDIVIKADLMDFFDAVHLATTNQIMIPGKQAAAMADIFQHVFEIKSINIRY